MYQYNKNIAYPEVSLLRVLLAADLTVEGFLPGVGDEVPLHGGHAHELLAAHPAHGQDFVATLPAPCMKQHNEFSRVYSRGRYIDSKTIFPLPRIMFFSV